MDEHRKNAYRFLLYWAMLDIRLYCPAWSGVSYNPLTWYRQYRSSRIAGAIAEWLHNLADFASRDFAGFSEDDFWLEYSSCCERFPEVTKYRNYFNSFLDQPRNDQSTGSA